MARIFVALNCLKPFFQNPSSNGYSSATFFRGSSIRISLDFFRFHVGKEEKSDCSGLLRGWRILPIPSWISRAMDEQKNKKVRDGYEETGRERPSGDSPGLRLGYSSLHVARRVPGKWFSSLTRSPVIFRIFRGCGGRLLLNFTPQCRHWKILSPVVIDDDYVRAKISTRRENNTHRFIYPTSSSDSLHEK